MFVSLHHDRIRTVKGSNVRSTIVLGTLFAAGAAYAVLIAEKQKNDRRVAVVRCV